jgi:phenylacetate-CoA ligase
MIPSTRNSVSDFDYLSRDHLQEIQWRKFEIILKHTYENGPWYHAQLEQLKLKPSDIKSFDDLHKLPFITKQVLRDTYPFGLFAVPMEKIVRMHASSGTTGKPIVVAHTKGDLAVWAEGVQRALLGYGVTTGDILHNAYGYGLFTGGLGLHDGGQSLGVTVVPVSGGNTERQVMLMRDFGATVVSCTPSYFLHIIDKAKEMGIDLRELPIRVGAFGAEPWSDEMRQCIEADAGIKAYDIYGLTEICGPGVGAECIHQNGTHLFEDHFYPEIINPETLEPLPDGEVGELVFTTLDRFAMPMIRYRLGDTASWVGGTCPCGRSLPRIDNVAGRVTDFLVGVDGQFCSGVAIATFIVSKRPSFGQIQIIQDERNKILYRVGCGKNKPLNQDDLNFLREQTELYLGKGIQIDYEFVDSIPHEASGKFLFSKSKAAKELMGNPSEA